MGLVRSSVDWSHPLFDKSKWLALPADHLGFRDGRANNAYCSSLSAAIVVGTALDYSGQQDVQRIRRREVPTAKNTAKQKPIRVVS